MEEGYSEFSGAVLKAQVYPWALTAMQMQLAYRRGIAQFALEAFVKAREELGRSIEYWRQHL